MTTNRSALIAGAGIFGLSIAAQLAHRGWSVRVISPTPPGSEGPSASETRILRFSHGDDAWYPALVQRARASWRALERESGRQLLLPSGVLVIGPPSPDRDDSWEQASARHLGRLGVPAELMDPAAAQRRFPDFDLRGCGTALFEPDGAVLLAREATLALARSARDRGAEFLTGTARPQAGTGQATVGGQPLPADITVWAVGTALPSLFPGLAPVREVRQDCWYVRPQGRWAAADGPAWLDRAHGYYGVPAVGSQGVKVVPDTETPQADPRDMPPHGLPPTVRAYLRSRLPDLADAPALRREPCAYTLTPDEHFLLARHPAHPAAWIVGGDSGHGFKHGPAWGAYVCDVIEGRQAPDPRFALR